MSDIIIYQPEDQPERERHSMQDYLRAAREQYDLVVGCAKQSVRHVWLMGQALTEAKEKHKLRKQKLGKDEPNWDVLLKQSGISVASDNRSRRMVAAFPDVEQVLGMGIMEAYMEAGITKLPSPKASEPVASVNATAQSESVAAGDSQTAADEGDEVDPTEATNESTALSNDEVVSTEDDFDSADDDQVDERTYVEMLSDIAADMDLLREAHHTEDLSDEEIEAVLSKVELIAQYALEIKMRLEEGIEAAA